MPLPIQQFETGDNLNVPIEEQAFSPEEQEEYDGLFLFEKARKNLKEIVDSWSEEINSTEARRNERNVDIDVKYLRDSGQINPDETFIPDRTIDTNIRREQPAYVNFLTQSRRLVIFKNDNIPPDKTQQLESAFTSGMTYEGWINPFLKEIDGSQAHGWAAVEVVYDETKPLHVSVESIEHDKLFFNLDTADLNQTELIRLYKVTPMQLKRWIYRYGFNADIIERALQINKQEKKRERTNVYKVFFKWEDVVYIAWFSLESGADDWLKPPQALRLGIYEQQQIKDTATGLNQPNWVETPIRQYPIFILPYRESEQDVIKEYKGRCYLDGPKQEAKTAILTGYVNRLMRSSNIYGSVVNDDGGGAAVKQLDIDLTPGTIFDKAINFFSIDPPDPSGLKALQYLDISNTEETGNISAAVSNRQDSRKTAKELELAEKSEIMFKSVPLVIFSNHIREVYSYVWPIVQSQALRNQISLLMIQQTNNIGIDEFVNDIKTISAKYDIRAAGDEDVIKRGERVQSMMQDWPVIQNTGAKFEFLADLIRLKYPEKGERYSQLVLQGDQMKQMIGAMAAMIQKLIKPEDLATLSPEEKQQLLTMQQMAQQITGDNQQPQQQPQQQQQQQQQPAQLTQ